MEIWPCSRIPPPPSLPAACLNQAGNTKFAQRPAYMDQICTTPSTHGPNLLNALHTWAELAPPSLSHAENGTPELPCPPHTSPHLAGFVPPHSSPAKWVAARNVAKAMELKQCFSRNYDSFIPRKCGGKDCGGRRGQPQCCPRNITPSYLGSVGTGVSREGGVTPSVVRATMFP
eukprot:365987-Chlamydomonas_euryale.AAC.13